MLARFLIVFITTLLLGLAPARADSMDQDARRAAHKQGIAAMQARKWQEAHDIYVALWSDRRSYDVALLLGQAELNLGKYRDAAEHLDFGIRNAPAREAPELVQRAQEFFDEAKQKVGLIEVQVDQAKADILIDGAPAGISPLPGPLFAAQGQHTIRAELPGFEPAQQAFEARAGSTTSLSLTLSPKENAAAAGSPSASAASESTAATPEPTPQAEPSKRSMVPVYIGAGVTAVALGVAIVFELSAQSNYDEAERLLDKNGPSACSTGAASPDDCSASRDATDAGDGQRTIATAGAIVAGAAAVGTVVYLLWPSGSNEGASARLKRPLAVSGSFDRNSSAIWVSGSF